MDISLALGGGGAKGLAHIGVIRSLEREGFRIRAVAGTSFGGLVAAFHAAGYDARQIEDLYAAVDQHLFFGGAARGGAALYDLSGARDWLTLTLGDRTFEDCIVPCAVTATNLDTGHEVLISHGLLREAVLAAIAFPGVFPPAEWQGQRLIDGAVIDPVPVANARSLAPGIPVIAVVLSLPAGPPSRRLSLPVTEHLPRIITRRLAKTRIARGWAVFMRSVDIGSRQLAELQLRLQQPDVVIRPAVEHIGLFDRVDVRLTTCLGDAAVEAAIPQLRELTA